ncbi:MAG: malonyl-CoA synthase [Thiohalophilus sp.]
MPDLNHNIYSVFQSCFPESRSATFIENETGQTWSYADLESESARLARFLTSLGVKKGDRVAVQVEKSPQAMFLYLACLRAGFIYLPLNTAYLENEIAYFLENAEPSVVICRATNQKMIQRLCDSQGVPHLFTLEQDGSGSLIEQAANTDNQFETVECAIDDVAVILYTSGTTGRPKGAMITHGNLANNGRALHQAWGWQPNDVLLHALPIFHIHGLFVACHCVLLNGSKMIFLPKFDTKEIIRQLPRATVFMGVPTFYTRLLADPEFTREVCDNMRLFTCGSAPLLEQTFEEFRQRTGQTILERYGMTETGMNTSNPLDGERIAGTVGMPLPGVSARIVDDNGKPVAKGEVGQLQVKGGNVFKGYWRMPEKTAEEFTEDGYFRTGDMAMQHDNGYYSIVGRAKDMVITGGYNVYPKEIESVIDDIDGVKESAVIGLPHPDFGEAVTAVIVPESGSNELDEQKIIQQLKTELANFKVPKRIFFVEELPRNTMGKVQKNILRDQFSG